MKTIHLITSAHLDPVWLWPWHNGLDAVLNTCRTMVKFLERHPQVIFTCGEAWKYRWIERLSPSLFKTIRGLVEQRRWEVTGGWWIQPDCNAPSGFALERQIELGLRYFRETFGAPPEVAFNVDSFGHAATLPHYIRNAGQKYYVMMRPQEHERQLPARLFHWRGYTDGPSVPTFRIAGGYGDFDRMSEDHLRLSLTELPEGIDETMCFLGLGDHGGGPNERLMQWFTNNASKLSDVKLVWSSPSRYFNSISSKLPFAPTVTGELQHHAVGCYSVYRPIKTAVRKSEHGLAQAETFATPADRAALDEHWRTVCFSHFHDTLGGTCIPSAYPIVEGQLGGIRAAADELMQIAVRRQVAELPGDPMQRIVIHNASELPFADHVVWEYWWRDGGDWQPQWRFLDEAGQVVPHQLVRTEAVVTGMMSRVIFWVEIGARQTRILRLDRRESGEATSSAKMAAAIDINRQTITIASANLPMPEISVLRDETDTWSHGIDRFSGQPHADMVWKEPMLQEDGPVLRSTLRRGRVAGSTILADWRAFSAASYVELRLKVEWATPHAVMKLVLPIKNMTHHIDGIPGGSLQRDPDGAERPMRDFVQIIRTDGPPIGIVSPDTYALDASPDGLRLTLLRNPLMAHHDPEVHTTPHPHARFSDFGTHDFVFRFYVGASLDTLNQDATALQRPPLIVDTTAGMLPI